MINQDVDEMWSQFFIGLCEDFANQFHWVFYRYAEAVILTNLLYLTEPDASLFLADRFFGVPAGPINADLEEEDRMDENHIMANPVLRELLRQGKL